MIAKRSVRFVSDDASRLQLAIKRNSGGKTVSVTKANQRQRCASLPVIPVCMSRQKYTQPKQENVNIRTEAFRDHGEKDECHLLQVLHYVL